MPAKKYFSSSIPVLKLVQFKFNSTVNFAKNNEITTSCIQKFSTRVTMNELLTNNGCNNKTFLKNNCFDYK